MSFFKSWVSFSLNFTSPFSVVTHNLSEIFLLKHYMLLTKRAHKYTIFQTFECCNKGSPSSLCHFWNYKVRIHSNFASLFIVIKDNSSVIFKVKPHILWTKIAHWDEIFGLLSGWMKSHQIPHVIFEFTCQFFLKLCITLQFHEK